MIFGYMITILATKTVVERLINFQLVYTNVKVDLRVVLFVAASTYFTFSSFLTLFCYNVIGFRMRFELICSVIMRSASIPEISKLYLRLCDSMLKFNRIFPISLELFINFSILSLAFSFYEIYFAVVNRAANEQQLGVCVLTNLWNFFLGSTILAIFYCCASFKEINERILIALTSQYHSTEDRNTRRRLSMFLMQVEHIQPQVLNGVYALDWKLFMQVRNLRTKSVEK